MPNQTNSSPYPVARSNGGFTLTVEHYGPGSGLLVLRREGILLNVIKADQARVFAAALIAASDAADDTRSPAVREIDRHIEAAKHNVPFVASRLRQLRDDVLASEAAA